MSFRKKIFFIIVVVTAADRSRVLAGHDSEPNGSSCDAKTEACSEFKSSSGHCNYLSRYKCGQPCTTESQCTPGSCWADIRENECDDILKYYCDSQSGVRCGQKCNDENDSNCSPGHCVAYEAPCSGSGYCNLESSNCGASCTNDSSCSGGHCLKEEQTCMSTATIGTYIGALPAGILAPSLQSIPKEVNLMMLSFAKDVNHDGHFLPFSEWERQGLTKSNIEKDKAVNPDRKYLVSLGGTAGFGGNFGIKPGMSTEQWVANSLHSVTDMIKSLSADGAEMQFEGNTNDAQFNDAMTGLLKGLKAKGYMTAIGPYYGPAGTWHDYKEISTEFVDFVNMQFYSVQENTATNVQYFIKAVQQELGVDSGKLVAGFNTNQSPPKPSVALEAVNMVQSSLKGAFTWDIEHSATTNKPPYCLEIGLAKILVEGSTPGECSWH